MVWGFRMGLAALLSGLSLFASLPAAAGGPRVLVVDDDGAQCPNAGFAAIQPAVAAARRGDTVRLCGGSYVGDLTVDKAVNLIAQSPAAPGVDCLGGGAVGPANSVITGAVTVTGSATGTKIDGLVVTGAAHTGVTTSAEGSGYQIRRNVIQGNGDFGIDLRSRGSQRTVVEDNCVRGNGVKGTLGVRAGIVGDFGDLRNAVIRRNSTVDNTEAISVSGLFNYSDISITDNIIRRETTVAAGLVNSVISRNDIDQTGAGTNVQGLVLGGGNVGLTVSANRIVGATGAGMFFCSVCLNDLNTKPNIGLMIAANSFRNGIGSGISMAAVGPDNPPIQLTRSVLYHNTIQGNGASGIFLNQTSVNNALLENTSTMNARGINLNDATGSLVLANTLTGNRIVDARDTKPGENRWIANTCVTDEPAGTLCSAPTTPIHIPAFAAHARSTAEPEVLGAPKVDQSRWPCLRVRVWDARPAGDGYWSWTTVTAPNASSGTHCGP